MSPGDFENLFIKARDRETKGRLRVKEVTGESLGGAALAHLKVREKGGLGGWIRGKPG